MDPIDVHGSFFAAGQQSRKKTEKAKKSKGLFSSVLKENTQARTEKVFNPGDSDAVGELLDQVYEAGDNLKNNQDMQSIQLYKKAVKNFLEAVVGNTYDVEQRTSGFSIANRKQFYLVKSVNAKLESLAAVVLTRQKDQLAILASVEEINGMLIDLTR